MTRAPFIAVAAVSLALCASGIHTPATKSDRERAELVGPVQSVSLRWQANHKDEYGQIEERALGAITYDRAGAIVVDTEVTPDFIRVKRPERPSPTVTIFRAIMGSAVEHYTFDSSGNVLECRRWYGDKAEGDPAIIERMKYDAAGRVIESESQDGSGKRFALTLYARDAAGHVVVEEDRADKSAPPYPRMHYTYTFDSHGNWTSRIVKRENVPEDAYMYRYAGNLYRTIVYFSPAVAP